MEVGAYVSLKENNDDLPEHAIVLKITNHKATLDRELDGSDEYPIESLMELSTYVGFRLNYVHRASPDQTMVIAQFDPDNKNIKEAFKIVAVNSSVLK